MIKKITGNPSLHCSLNVKWGYVFLLNFDLYAVRRVFWFHTKFAYRVRLLIGNFVWNKTTCRRCYILHIRGFLEPDLYVAHPRRKISISANNVIFQF